MLFKFNLLSIYIFYLTFFFFILFCVIQLTI
ncbi:hypothetical protein CoNPh26_CDS0075 [Staphylococcus phage S-CoN_Ph26]|nr:hypothetical protein CoNPh26_CDS0075 [Staphylococcus phage S-CoN_Ph26]